MKSCVVDPQHRVGMPRFCKHGVDIYRCRDCGCIMADISFDHAQYESGSYYTLSRKTLADIDEEWGFRWRHILRRIREGGGAGGGINSLLDVGAGNGYFVALAGREYGLAATGIEISAEEIRFAREVVGVELLRGDVARHPAQYDVVTCLSVLEHVADPLGFLSDAIARVRPGGILALTTPNPGCIHARVKGIERWNMVDPPHHINLFSRTALEQILGARNMRVVRYETLSTYINFVRRFDTDRLVLRRLFFNALRLGHVGADHFLIAQKEPEAPCCGPSDNS
jgi:2-polyprenyl-3-methyl-5-hydroxy-6-metoxy-1,4-benzoquinol methylase